MTILQTQTKYTIEKIEIENSGRHRLLLANGVFFSLEDKEIRTLLARHLYKRMGQRPAYIFVYDREEDFNYPLGFTIARLMLREDAKHYTVDICERENLNSPSVDDFALYDAWCNYEREYKELPDSLESEHGQIVKKCSQFLYHAPYRSFQNSV